MQLVRRFLRFRFRWQQPVFGIFQGTHRKFGFTEINSTANLGWKKTTVFLVCQSFLASEFHFFPILFPNFYDWNARGKQVSP